MNDFRGLVTIRQKAFLRLIFALIGCICLIACPAFAEDSGKIVLQRGEATVVLEPYAPNIIRVTLSMQKDDATAAPGYGITAHPDPSGWSYRHTDGTDTYQSSRLVVSLPIWHGGGKPMSTCVATGLPPPCQMGRETTRRED